MGSKDRSLEARIRINLDGDINYERKTIEIDNLKIDTLCMTKPSVRRWTVLSLGIRSLYEVRVAQGCENDPNAGPLQQMMDACKTNLVIYNYPGMGADDTGPLSRGATIKAHNAVLEFLYEQKNPRQVVDYGHSFGGFVISEGKPSRPSKQNVPVITVFDRTDLQASNILWNDGYDAWTLNKLCGWNMGIDLSKEENPVIGMMCVDTNKAVRIHRGDSFVYNDKAVTQATCIANVLLNTAEDPVVIGIPGCHNDTCPDFSMLGERIEEIFQRSHSAGTGE